MVSGRAAWAKPGGPGAEGMGAGVPVGHSGKSVRADYQKEGAAERERQSPGVLVTHPPSCS